MQASEAFLPELADGRLLATFLHGLPFVGTICGVFPCVLISSSYKDSSHIGLGPTLTA